METSMTWVERYPSGHIYSKFSGRGHAEIPDGPWVQAKDFDALAAEPDRISASFQRIVDRQDLEIARLKNLLRMAEKDLATVEREIQGVVPGCFAPSLPMIRMALGSPASGVKS
jgi:hypothetical protein